MSALTNKFRLCLTSIVKSMCKFMTNNATKPSKVQLTSEVETVIIDAAQQ